MGCVGLLRARRRCRGCPALSRDIGAISKRSGGDRNAARPRNGMTALRLIALAMILLVGDIVAVHGQTPSPLPPGMTQDQFDAMVDAIGKAVVVKLKNEGVVPAPPSVAAPSQPGVASNVVADELAA